MNHIIIFMIMLLVHIPMNCSDKIPATNVLHALVDNENQPTIFLLQLLEKTDCSHDGTLPSILESTQKKWLRKAGMERWENQTNVVPDAEYLQLFKKLYLIQEIFPTQKSYDYALFLGGVLDDVRMRLKYLINVWNEGVRFKSLVILTGQRPLDPQIESKESLSRNNSTNVILPTTESEMIQFVFAQTNDVPAEWEALITLIDAPMQKIADDSWRRPNTEDTIKEWLQKHNLGPGSILAISNQPFVGYQHAVLRKNLRDFAIETIGPVYENNESLATILDAITRQFYNENLIIHNQPAKY